MKKIILFFIVFVLFGCTNPQYFVIDDTKIIAFQNVSDDVVHLTIPEGITEIKTNLLVFAHLKTIQLPSSLSFLNPNIFIGCEKLTEIVISDDNEKFMTKNGVLFTKNENILLYYPEGKTSSSFIANNPSIGKKAFYNNVYLEEIILTNEVLKINDSAFEGCSNLKQITLSENLREIPDFAFKNCINLQEIEISPLVKTIGEQAFANTISLKSLMIPSHVFYIKNEAFFNFSTNQTIYFDHDGEFILWDSTWKNGCMAQLFFLGTIKNQKLYMALGDSVAAGHMSDNTMGLGYADYLGEKLVLSHDVTNFHNDFAKSGMTSSGLLYR
ncbi:MAG: leucine-rich repeat domain-containing protein, partial [Bacilli bacterium]|nr:leucine-rich repeat domain-containing protein [Bacilli bacterium]